MSAWGWYLDAWHNYAEFEGRSSRPAYWYFALVHLIVVFICVYLDGSFAMSFTPFRWPFPILTALYGLAAVIPGWSLTVRRLHDRDISGWLILILVVPVLGAFILLYQFVQDSKPGDNRHGPNPKGLQDE